MLKKFLIGGVLLFVVVFLSLNLGSKKDFKTDEQLVYRNTIDISRAYAVLRLKTNKILTTASDYSDYNTWNDEITKLIKSWEDLEKKANDLEKQANFLSEDKLSFQFVDKVHAFSKDEISNVFDKAPAGKKIRTLAKYLGVDAKRAYKILQNDQEYVKADAWNEAGDTFKKLEVSAIVIKDGCKVAAFIGAAAMTGGAVAGASVGSAGVGTALVGGSATLAEGTVMVVTGTDLMLEIGEDTATIALGDKHKAVKAISGVRAYTDPAASILSLTDIPKNIAKGAAFLDKVGVVLMQVDQIRSMVQDGKLLGINIKPGSKVEIASIKEDEIEEWLDEHIINDDSSEDLDDWLDGFDDLDDWMDEFENEVEEDGDEISEEDEDEELEEVAEDPNSKKGYSEDGKVSVSIIKPNGILSSGGTQMWEIKVDGYKYLDEDNQYIGEKRGYICYWDYYTEYDEGVKPWMNMKGCRNVHGVPGKDIFIGEDPGELRVVARVDFLEQDYSIDEWGNKFQDGKKVVETVSAERIYEISPYFSH